MDKLKEALTKSFPEEVERVSKGKELTKQSQGRIHIFVCGWAQALQAHDVKLPAGIPLMLMSGRCDSLLK